MLVLVWSTFCNQFSAQVFSKVSKETIILVAFLNVALYLFTSLICLWTARPPFPSKRSSLLPLFGPGSVEPAMIATLHRLVRKITFGKRETAAICFCGAAKGKVLSLGTRKLTLIPTGLVLGAPLISIMYSAYDDKSQAALTVPIALYQGEHLSNIRYQLSWLTLRTGTQIAIAQFSVVVVKRWILRGEDSESEAWEPAAKEAPGHADANSGVVEHADDNVRKGATPWCTYTANLQ